jgi:signal transduction histidine kinase
MRLSEFIVANRESILVEWEAFARTCTPAAGTMNIAALRDHASEMLTVIAADLNTRQTRVAQEEKSKGEAEADEPEAVTAAEEHGSGRARSGFTIAQMVAEYRALRASVIRLWTVEQKGIATAEVEDLTRFNEAIDQALAESTAEYTESLDRSKEMFLAILGHDLRTPLGAILAAAQYMLDTADLKDPYDTLASRIATSADRMVQMVGDLLDFTRSTLGDGIPTVRAPLSMARLVRDVVAELTAVHPERRLQVEVQGEQEGEWDGARMSQALGNLISNALIHGTDTPVTVQVSGDEHEVTVAVHNSGEPIAGEDLDGIFNPMKARRVGPSRRANDPWASLGLGLYIAERIVSAHRGTIEVQSSEQSGTTFTVRLPRR